MDLVISLKAMDGNIHFSYLQYPEGLIKLMGANQNYCYKFDAFFIAKADLGDKAPTYISSLIGHYAPGNEHSHYIVYMYTYAGQQ